MNNLYDFTILLNNIKDNEITLEMKEIFMSFDIAVIQHYILQLRNIRDDTSKEYSIKLLETFDTLFYNFISNVLALFCYREHESVEDAISGFHTNLEEIIVKSNEDPITFTCKTTDEVEKILKLHNKRKYIFYTLKIKSKYNVLELIRIIMTSLYVQNKDLMIKDVIDKLSDKTKIEKNVLLSFNLDAIIRYYRKYKDLTNLTIAEIIKEQMCVLKLVVYVILNAFIVIKTNLNSNSSYNYYKSAYSASNTKDLLKKKTNFTFDDILLMTTRFILFSVQDNVQMITKFKQ
jgi:hypothetical protein